jgi:hypothetical protein
MRLFLILMALFLSGCSASTTQVTTIKDYPIDGKGYVLLSFSQQNKNSNEKNSIGVDSSLLYENKVSGEQGIIRPKDKSKAHDGNGDFQNPDGLLLLKELESGEYVHNNITADVVGVRYVSIHDNARYRHSIRNGKYHFTVKPNTITYLGDYMTHVTLNKDSGLFDNVIQKVEIQIKDSRNRDISLFKKLYPGFQHLNIDYSVTPTIREIGAIKASQRLYLDPH